MTETDLSPGKRFRNALDNENPLQIVGTINAMAALLAKQAGFQAIYLSGAGVANASFGIPDLGLTNLNEVLEDVYRITDTVDLPLLVDIDTGFGGCFQIARTIRRMMKAGVSAVHIEDQVAAKRCGQRPGKVCIKTAEMVDRIKSAVDARTDPSFIIMARTDALAAEGLDATISRIQSYSDAGADMIFFEGAREVAEYQLVTKQCSVPVLANITEFGVTPLLTKDELAKAGIRMVLYPLSAFRAMNFAALHVYQTIRKKGTQERLLDQMQTRNELYESLDYLSYETKLDQLFEEEKEK